MLKKIVILFFIFLGHSKAQDLYSFKNSFLYADYLLKSGQYDRAHREFERLVFMDPSSDSLKLMLLKSYRLDAKNEIGILRAGQLFSDLDNAPFGIAMEYSKLLLNQRDWQLANNFWSSSKTIPETDKILLKTTVKIFESDFKNANSILSPIQSLDHELVKGYVSILDRGSKQHLKSPALAGIMSAVVPGSGKLYSKNWRDGLVSLIFVGGMAFQTVRNFNKHGINNYRGWVYGGIGAGFYLGNIYGSVKSTKDFNRKKINILQHEASNLFNMHY